MSQELRPRELETEGEARPHWSGIVWLGIDKDDARVVRVALFIAAAAILAAATLGAAWRVFHAISGIGD